MPNAKLIGIILIGITLAIIIVVVIVVIMMQKKSTTSTQNTTTTTQNTTTQDTTIPTGVNYISPYNYNYQSAVSYCKTNNGVLATEDNLNEMQKKGFENCGYGWMVDNTGTPGIAIVRQTYDVNCGSPPLQIQRGRGQNDIFGAYCVGPKIATSSNFV